MPPYRIFPTLASFFAVTTLALAQTPSPKPATTPASATPPASAPTLTPPAPPTDAEKTLDEAIAKIKALKSVAADISQAVEMLGQKFRLTGRYLKGTGNRVSLTLAIEGLGDTEGRMWQVCDGVTLWDVAQILGPSNPASYRKLQILPVLKKLESPGWSADLRDRVLAQIGFAGPEALLIGLRKSVAFNQKKEDILDGKKVWILRGSWKDYESLNPPGQMPVNPLALPPYVPSVVAVYIGQDDGWPYKVELYGQVPSDLLKPRDDRPLDLTGKPIGAKTTRPRKEDPSKIILTYSNVRLNPTLDPREFAFQPPADVAVADGTERLVADLETLLTAEQTNRKQAEAQKGGATSAVDAIPVPSPPGASPPPPGSTFRTTQPPPGR